MILGELSLRKFYRHKRQGSTYRVLFLGIMKQDEAGEWSSSVTYVSNTDPDLPPCTRDIEHFKANFEEVK
jgi:hypothetical protein